MTKKILRMIVGGLAAVLGILGFACCYGPAVEYGVPYTTYQFQANGVVKDASGDTIPGISVKLVPQFNQDSDYYNAVSTNAEGDYETEIVEGKNNILIIKVEDIDGAENGEYQNKDVTVDFNDVTADYSNDIDYGKKIKKIDITLEEI